MSEKLLSPLKISSKSIGYFKSPGKLTALMDKLPFSPSRSDQEASSLSICEEKYRKLVSSTDYAMKAFNLELKQASTKIHHLQISLQDTTEDYSKKLDTATSRILELETIFALLKVEDEEKKKDLTLHLTSLSEELVILRDILQQCQHHVTTNQGSHIAPLVDLFAQFSTSFNQCDRCLYGLHAHSDHVINNNNNSKQRSASFLPEETADLFQTINQLNSTIKVLKLKAGTKIKGLTSTLQETEKEMMMIKQQLRDKLVENERLQYEVILLQEKAKEDREALIRRQVEEQQQQEEKDKKKNGNSNSSNSSYRVQIRLLQEECRALQSYRDQYEELLTQQTQLEQETKAAAAIQKKNSNRSSDSMQSRVIQTEDRPELEITMAKSAWLTWQAEHAQFQQTTQTLTQEKATLQQQATTLEQDLQRITKQLREEQSSKARHEQGQLHQAQLQTQQQAAALQQTIDDLRLQLRIEMTSHSQQDTRQQQVIASLTQQLGDLTVKCQGLQERLDSQRLKMKALQHKVIELEKGNKEYCKKLEEVKEELSSWQYYMKDVLVNEMIVVKIESVMNHFNRFEQSLLATNSSEGNKEEADKRGEGILLKLEQKLSFFQKQIAFLSSHLTSLQSSVKAKEEKVKDQQIEISRSDEVLRQYVKMRKDQAAEIIGLKKAMKNMEEDVHALLTKKESEILHLQQETTRLQEETIQQKEKLAILEEQLSTKMKEATSLDILNIEYKSKLSLVESVTLPSLQEEVKQTSSKLRSLHEERLLDQEKLLKHTLEKDKLEEEVLRQKEKYVSLRMEADSNRAQRKHSEATLQTLQTEYQQMKKLAQEKEKQIVALTDALAADKKECKVVVDKLQHDQKETVANLLKLHEEEVANIKQQLKDKQEQIQQIAMEGQVYHDRCLEKDTRYEETVSELYKEINDWKMKLDAYSKQHSHCHQTIQELQESQQDLLHQLEVSQIQYDQQEKDMHIMVDRFQEELFHLQSQLAEISNHSYHSEEDNGDGVDDGSYFVNESR